MELLTQKSINYCAEICRAQDCETYHGVRNDVCGDAAIYNRLAAYEDLEEQGRLIVLPCKVGDTVYKPLGKNEEILPIKIQWFETNNYGWCACGTYPPRATYAIRFAYLGKTWFTDRAEAEKAMEVSEDA